MLLGASGGAEANFLSAANVAEARSKLGERGEELDTMIVHPSVAYYLYQVGMLTFSTSALSASGAVTWGGGGVGIGAREVGEFAGMRVIVDSQVNTVAPGTSGHQREFRCYMMKSGTILEGVQQDLRIEADRNVLSKQDVLSVDYHSTYHVMGTKWSNAADNPTNANLLPGNWAATYDIDLIPMVQMTVNSPSGYHHHLILIRAKALPLGGATFFLRYGCHDQRHTEECDSQQLCNAGRSQRVF